MNLRSLWITTEYFYRTTCPKGSTVPAGVTNRTSVRSKMIKIMLIEKFDWIWWFWPERTGVTQVDNVIDLIHSKVPDVQGELVTRPLIGIRMSKPRIFRDGIVPDPRITKIWRQIWGWDFAKTYCFGISQTSLFQNFASWAWLAITVLNL